MEYGWFGVHAKGEIISSVSQFAGANRIASAGNQHVRESWILGIGYHGILLGRTVLSETHPQREKDRVSRREDILRLQACNPTLPPFVPQSAQKGRFI